MPDYKHTRPLIMLIPLAIGANFKALLAIMAKWLDMAMDYLNSMIDEFFPLTADKSIAMWEEELGITDPADTLEERQQDAYIRHKGEGASTMDDILAIVIGMGMQGVLIRNLPFQAGLSRAGDRLWGAEWLLRLDIQITSTDTAAQLERLRVRINELIPADISGGIIYGSQYISWR